MHQVEDQAFLPAQLDADILVSDRIGAAATPCVTSGIGREALLVRGAPRLPIGCQVELSLLGKRHDPLSIRCVVSGQNGPDQMLTYEGLTFEERARLEELMRPNWDGSDLFDGLMTMAGLYGATSLKDWLCMTTLLERIQPRVAHRRSTFA